MLRDRLSDGRVRSVRDHAVPQEPGLVRVGGRMNAEGMKAWRYGRENANACYNVEVDSAVTGDCMCAYCRVEGLTCIFGPIRIITTAIRNKYCFCHIGPPNIQERVLHSLSMTCKYLNYSSICLGFN